MLILWLFACLLCNLFVYLLVVCVIVWLCGSLWICSLFVCWLVCLFVYCLCVCLLLFVWLFVWLFDSLIDCLFVSLFVWLFDCFCVLYCGAALCAWLFVSSCVCRPGMMPSCWPDCAAHAGLLLWSCSATGWRSERLVCQRCVHLCLLRVWFHWCVLCVAGFHAFVCFLLWFCFVAFIFCFYCLLVVDPGRPAADQLRPLVSGWAGVHCLLALCCVCLLWLIDWLVVWLFVCSFRLLAGCQAAPAGFRLGWCWLLVSTLLCLLVVIGWLIGGLSVWLLCLLVGCHVATSGVFAKAGLWLVALLIN